MGCVFTHFSWHQANNNVDNVAEQKLFMKRLWISVDVRYNQNNMDAVGFSPGENKEREQKHYATSF